MELEKGWVTMARESKAELEICEVVTKHLLPEEILREYTWGAKDSSSMAHFLFGAIGAALARQDQAGFYIGLTNKRIILVEVKGRSATGEVYSIPLADIKGLHYKRGASTGTLDIHLTADKLQLNFDRKPWYPRAQNMSKLMPI
jgi:PH (Pleckstrin Homology) domain-containing protein